MVADGGTNLDVSAFLVLAQYAYRDLRVFELSTVVRAIVTEGTIYFLAMLAIQIYTLLSFVLMEVCLFLSVRTPSRTNLNS